MSNTVILGTARTPVGKLGGGLSSLQATELGGIAIKAALERAGVAPDQIQHVVMGQVLQAGPGGYGCAAICSGGGQGDAVIIKV